TAATATPPARLCAGAASSPATSPTRACATTSDSRWAHRSRTTASSRRSAPWERNYSMRNESDRTAVVERNTAETQIRVELNVDGTGRHDISTGIGFFDHMLTAFARHGRFDLTVRAT